MESTFELEKKEYLNELSKNTIINGIFDIIDFIREYQNAVSTSAYTFIISQESISLLNYEILSFISNSDYMDSLARKQNLIKNPNSLEEIEIARNYCMFFEDLFFKVCYRILHKDQRGIKGIEPINKSKIKLFYDFFVNCKNFVKDDYQNEYEEYKNTSLKSIDDVFSQKEEIEEFMKKLVLYEDIEFYRYSELGELIWNDNFKNDSKFKNFDDFMDNYFIPLLNVIYDIYFVYPTEHLLTCDDDSIINVVSTKFHNLFIEKYNNERIVIYSLMQEIIDSINESINEFDNNYSKNYNQPILKS